MPPKSELLNFQYPSPFTISLSLKWIKQPLWSEVGTEMMWQSTVLSNVLVVDKIQSSLLATNGVLFDHVKSLLSPCIV